MSWWTLNELSELTWEERNLTLCTRVSMGLTYDRDPTMMCDLNGRLFNVSPVTLGNVLNVGSRENCLCVDLFLRTLLHHHAAWLFTLTLHLKGEYHVNERLAYGRIDGFLYPIMFMKIWICCCTVRRCLDEGNTRIVPAKWRLCRRAKDTFEWPANVSGQSRGRYVSFFWWSPEMFVMGPFLWVEKKVVTRSTWRDRLSIQPPTDEDYLYPGNI